MRLEPAGFRTLRFRLRHQSFEPVGPVRRPRRRHLAGSEVALALHQSR